MLSRYDNNSTNKTNIQNIVQQTVGGCQVRREGGAKFQSQDIIQ